MDYQFLEELKEGTIQIHDDLQFELKQEFYPNDKENIFIQEFYLFIPESLVINPETYSKSAFYVDETNFIRYKTPNLTFKELINPLSKKSPLNIILAMSLEDEHQLKLIIDEIKLFGNIFRSTLRNETFFLVHQMQNEIQKVEQLKNAIEEFLDNVSKTHSHFLQVVDLLEKKHQNLNLTENLRFVDEFITNTIEYYLTGFLKEVRNFQSPILNLCDKKFCEILIFEANHRKNLLPQITNLTGQKLQEMIAYRQNLLQKFMLEALQLKSDRIAASKQHGALFQSIAAGCAMLIYMLLFTLTWASATFVINSIPFVLSLVVFYILKDRIKEGVKTYYAQKAVEWFSDYKTKIYSKEGTPLGFLKENFYFINKENLHPEIDKVRNDGFHNHLETLHRHETIMLYKREVSLISTLNELTLLNELNMIFRYNIHRFLEKASDPIQQKALLDEETLEIHTEHIPKVYHLNIVMKEINFVGKTQESKIKKFRVILDKNGIIKVENL